MNTQVINNREIFDCFVHHEELKKLRVSFDFLLGRPLWWVCFKINGDPKVFRAAVASSYEIWHDPRVKKYPFSKNVFDALKKKRKDARPFLFQAPKDVIHFCVPLTVDGKVVGYFGVSDVKKGIRQEVWNLLTGSIGLILENCTKKEELSRLSATIRPRAIALSTVHTVHRIINSTLNLDELISRLAHLTAQVLRAGRCAIFILDKTSASKNNKRSGHLVCRALVGFPKTKKKDFSIQPGVGLEGRVAKTAQVVLRKKLISIPLIDEDVIGVLTVSHKKDHKPFTYFDQEILTTLAEEAVIAIKNAQLYEEQKKVTLGTIQSLAVILGTRVPTVIAPEVFLRLALRMAEEIHMSEEEMQALHYATLLKDTAKIGIPDEILKKPSKLTGEEYRILRAHPIKGARIVESFESLKPVVPIILYSREKFDGTGYPKGLKGDKIPLGARILAVINAFEAIIIGRPYRDRASVQDAIAEITKNRGTQFDPMVVDVFVRILEKEDFYKYLKNA